MKKIYTIHQRTISFGDDEEPDFIDKFALILWTSISAIALIALIIYIIIIH